MESTISRDQEECLLTDRCRHAYCPAFCEENVYLMLSKMSMGKPADQFAVVFVSNAHKCLPVYNQVIGNADNRYVVFWDYHVILVDTNPLRVFDLDSRLEFPCPFARFVEMSFDSGPDVPEDMRPRCHVIPGDVYLEKFSSDRSHMLNSNGEWIFPPPTWDPIVLDNAPNSMEQLLDLRTLGDSAFGGEVLNWHDFLIRFRPASSCASTFF